MFDHDHRFNVFFKAFLNAVIKNPNDNIKNIKNQFWLTRLGRVISNQLGYFSDRLLFTYYYL